MKLFIDIGAPEMVIVLLAYFAIFILAVYLIRGIFKIKKFNKYQAAQTRLLSEIARQQGVDENIIKEIEATIK